MTRRASKLSLPKVPKQQSLPCKVWYFYSSADILSQNCSLGSHYAIIKYSCPWSSFPVCSGELGLEGLKEWGQGQGGKHIKYWNTPENQNSPKNTNTHTRIHTPLSFLNTCSPGAPFLGVNCNERESSYSSWRLTLQKCCLFKEPIKPQHKKYLKSSWRSSIFPVLAKSGAMVFSFYSQKFLDF